MQVQLWLQSLGAACQGRSDVAWHPPDIPNLGRLGTDRTWADPARAICHGCPCRSECLDHALRKSEHGVWGGTLDLERRHLRGYLPPNSSNRPPPCPHCGSDLTVHANNPRTEAICLACLYEFKPETLEAVYP
jgi:hypothetical protein